jgi:hypothetical protein
MAGIVDCSSEGPSSVWGTSESVNSDSLTYLVLETLNELLWWWLDVEGSEEDPEDEGWGMDEKAWLVEKE